MDNPSNARVFESVDGLLAVSALLQDSETPRSVKKAVLEFLYFYLLPEDPPPGNSPPGSSQYSTDTAFRVGQPKPKVGSKGSNSTGIGSGEWDSSEIGEYQTLRRTPKEKQKLLSKFLDSEGELFKEFEEAKIFESSVG
jgi:hypothetical protein